MSKDIIVLTPNGRRLTVHCSPDTSILQVLEDVCTKQGFNANDYGLKHHNKVLDLTTTIRFSNLPNKACVEMVEVEPRRDDTNVTVALVLEDGQRITAEFLPSTNLFDLVSAMAGSKLSSLQNPSVQYMRQEVVGTEAMKGKTLRQLGLIHGRAILRLLNKAEEQTQANVSVVYKVKPKDEGTKDQRPTDHIHSEHVTFNPVNLLKEQKSSHIETEASNLDLKEQIEAEKPQVTATASDVAPVAMDVDSSASPSHEPQTSKSTFDHANLERRLKIEDEVIFVGSQKAIVFRQAAQGSEGPELPDEFYSLSVEEARRLQRELGAARAALERPPLPAAAAAQSSQQELNTYKNAVVRIQFPDHFILQGVFLPSNTIKCVTDFIKQHLATPEKPFLIFTTPVKEHLDPNMTLAEARFVPCVHMHFKWLSDDLDGPYLHDEINLKLTPSDAANILASKYRAPTRRKEKEGSQPQPVAGTSTSKLPKWFKI